MTLTEKAKKVSAKSIIRKAGYIMLGSLLFFIIVMVILITVLWRLSSGTPKRFLDKKGKPLAGSIAEKIYVKINDVEQGMFIKGKDKTKPVLLFLHGGPSMPEYAISQEYTTVLENDFVVCWWEQRGSGLSFDSKIPLETITIEQMISDVHAVTNYLRKRFEKRKIYLMAHSWGTLIGIQAAAREPELYKAYLSMAQITRQFESEKIAYEYMLQQYEANGDKEMLKKLEKFPINQMSTMPRLYRSIRDEAMHKLGIGTTRNMKSVESGIFLPVMKCSEYTLREKINLWRGKWSDYSANLWDQMLLTDITRKVGRVNVPVYFFHGLYDYTVSYTLAKNYFDILQAPQKGFYTFAKSAHSPLFEEPEKMKHILQDDVLNDRIGLADMR